MTSKQFQRMKERSDQTFEMLLGHIRFDVGKHKSKKLKCLGVKAKRTLLDNEVRKTHASRLENMFLRRWGNLTKREASDRLRFWTALDSLVVLDEDEIVAAVERMFSRLEMCCRKVKGIEVIGAAEIEIVNLRKLRECADGVDEARKYNVILEMLPHEEKTLFREGIQSYALVHFHGIVDFGNEAERKIDEFKQHCKWWWSGAYEVELKSLFEKNSVRKNLCALASYLTKGGNENLIYKIGFGSDSEDKINRQLLKKGMAKVEDDYEGFENEFSLSIQEIKVLGSVIDKVMNRKNSKLRNGYLFKYGQQQKWVGR